MFSEGSAQRSSTISFVSTQPLGLVGKCNGGLRIQMQGPATAAAFAPNPLGLHRRLAAGYEAWTVIGYAQLFWPTKSYKIRERERELCVCVCDMKVDGILAYACPEQHQTRISYICLCDSFGTPRAISHHRME